MLPASCIGVWNISNIPAMLPHATKLDIHYQLENPSVSFFRYPFDPASQA